MTEEPYTRVLRDLSVDPQRAWQFFLESYSPVILQVVRLFEREQDRVADCYLFACEQLARDSFRRLRRFRPNGAASFATWLRAVVHNLCVDWRRREFGRERPLAAIKALPGLEREVFRCRFQWRLTAHETRLSLAPAFRDLTLERVAAAEETIRKALSARQLWLLSTPVRVESLAKAAAADAPGEGEAAELDLPDSRPGPESIALEREAVTRLARAVRSLPDSDRLLLRVRFEQGLTLAEIARLIGLNGAQQADRRLRDILARLRAGV